MRRAVDDDFVTKLNIAKEILDDMQRAADDDFVARLSIAKRNIGRYLGRRADDGGRGAYGRHISSCHLEKSKNEHNGYFSFLSLAFTSEI